MTDLNIHNALLAYESVRLPRTHAVINGSRLSGKNYELSGEYGDDLIRVAAHNEALTRWISEDDPEEDVQIALDRMKTY